MCYVWLTVIASNEFVNWKTTIAFFWLHASLHMLLHTSPIFHNFLQRFKWIEFEVAIANTTLINAPVFVVKRHDLYIRLSIQCWNCLHVFLTWWHKRSYGYIVIYNTNVLHGRTATMSCFCIASMPLKKLHYLRVNGVFYYYARYAYRCSLYIFAMKFLKLIMNCLQLIYYIN
jgi:hypothetical protein